MSASSPAVRNKQPFDAGRVAYLTLNGLLLKVVTAPTKPPRYLANGS